MKILSKILRAKGKHTSILKKYLKEIFLREKDIINLSPLNKSTLIDFLFYLPEILQMATTLTYVKNWFVRIGIIDSVSKICLE